MVLDAVGAAPSVRQTRRFILRGALPMAALLIAVGVALLFVSGRLPHVGGYVFSCLLPFLLVAAQRREAAHLLAQEGIARPARERFFASGLLVIGFAVAVIHAWAFAWAVS